MKLEDRDPDSVDIAFSTGAGGQPGSGNFNVEAHLEGIAHLASIGVSWLHVGLPGDSLEHVIETIQRYGEQVIAVV